MNARFLSLFFILLFPGFAIYPQNASDCLICSTAPGVVVAYDFFTPSANGGIVKCGSLKASPHVTCYQQNDFYYGKYAVVDTAVFSPGSRASLCTAAL